MKKTQAWFLIWSALSLAGIWTYTARVLIPYQITYSAAHDRPRGNLSDLYPRWLGARELLLHGRDPYSPEISREIQAGYYGRVLDPNRRSDPKDQQAFVYPLYVVFYLAPTIHASFPSVQHVFFWVLLGLTVVSVPIWLRVVDWRAPVCIQVSIAALTIGSLGGMQGLKLQQLTLFVAPLIGLAMLLLIWDRQVLAGVVLALASIKPQLICLLCLWLLIWTAGDWRRRWRWLAALLLTMGLLLGGSLQLLPHWIAEFLHAMREYRGYVQSLSVAEVLMPRPLSWLLELVALGATLHATWTTRRSAARSPEFRHMTSVVLTITVFLIPAFSPYNQILLLPVVFWAVRQRHSIWGSSTAVRALCLLTMALLCWPWVAATALAALSYVLPSELVQKGWALPWLTAVGIPFAATALMLVYTQRTPVASSAAQQPA
jgi:hypothetical protein